MFLSRAIHGRVILHRCIRRTVVQTSSSKTSQLPRAEEKLELEDDGLIYNSLTGGLKEIRRQKRVEQLIEKTNATSSANCEPLSISFLSPEMKSKLLGELENYVAEPVKAQTENLQHLTQHLQTEKANLVENMKDAELTEENLLDFMTSTSSNPRIPSSKVPCGGCGAELHCQNHNYPGFIPMECFEGVAPMHLRAQVCQRCYILKHHKKALQVDISPDEYPRILQQIRGKKALVILIVDLMDFPCSIWPHLNDIIGSNRPVCVVGNKVDLLPKDSSIFLQRVEHSLREEVTRVAGIKSNNIKHVALVSAKTGFGIEGLINKLHKSWSVQGDVYLVGCTNVGKSSIFNALLDSDYCKVQASDAVQRATISNWPGTTLNLLKFPILRPDHKMLYERTMRLMSERPEVHAVAKDRNDVLRQTRDLEHATLAAPVEKTYGLAKTETKDPFSLKANRPLNFKPEFGIDARDREYVDSKWCYDTPGVVYPEQVINILTEQELAKVLPDSIISPRTLTLRKGQTFFLAGLGRIDYLDGSGLSMMLTVFSSSELPLTVCWTQNADSVYSKYLGTDNFLVPFGDKKRLEVWPGLKCAPEIEFKGCGWKESVADLVLSSAGWVSITLGLDHTAVLQAHTPFGLGVHARMPILPFAVARRGPRVERTPMFEKYRPLLEGQK